MVNLSDLLSLEKISVAPKLCYTDFISDVEDEKENTRKRILKSRFDGRYFYHEMKDGEVKKCFEMALDCQPFQGVSIFAFTPDDIHICTMDSRFLGEIEWKCLKLNQIVSGMSFDFMGNRFEFVSDDTISVNGKIIKVELCNKSVFKLLKSKIKAIDGARGLFSFLEQNNNNGFCNVYAKLILERYC